MDQVPPQPPGQNGQRLQQPEELGNLIHILILQIPLQLVLPVPMAMNWFYFKPEFSGKPEEDLEVPLLITIDWMDTHNCAADKRVRVSFIPSMQSKITNHCIHFKVIGKNYWRGLNAVCKICNKREELFHAWRSFQFDENGGTIDAYVQRIRQVAGMLNYGEPQYLKVFKNSTLTFVLDIISN